MSMEIKSINIFPIKSFQAISQDKSKIISSGLEYDRILAINKIGVKDSTQNWLSLRERPDLYLFTTNLIGSILTIGHKNSKNCVEIDLHKVSQVINEQIELNVWDDKVITEAVEGEANRFISNMLNLSIQLVSYLSREISRERYKVFPKPPTIQDGFPISVANEASLKALNENLISSGCSPVLMNQFRSNLIIDSGKAFDENSYNGLLINDEQKLHFKESISRCIVTQIDSNTGMKKYDQPVVKTLSQINNIGRPDNEAKTKPRFAIGTYPDEKTIDTIIVVNNRADYF
jgi:uncharacterized protein